ncbi:MAG: T9SS type A sorting domain-containing protein [Flavobacteriales bacterium]|nr:T9SS type A sorting domain-containing protein [Flavobacteriales bacterium]
MKLRLYFLIVLLFSFSTSFSQVHTINTDTLGNTFSPDTIVIFLGDTVEFVLPFNHNAVEVDEATWLVNGTTPAINGFNFGFGVTANFIPDSAKTYYYVCALHASMGMKGVIIVNPITYGCTDSTSLNYNPLATIDDGTCLYCPENGLVFNVGGGIADNEISWGLVEIGNSWASASGSSGVSYACVQDNCYQFRMYDSGGDGWNGATYSIMDSIGNILASGTLINGTNGTDIVQIGTSVICPIFGCTDSLSLNYNSLATVDDGSCSPLAENLFFSEYGEGSSNNKYFEIYNPTSNIVDLTNYAFARVSNSPGNGVGIYEYWVDFDSAAIILPNDVYVVVHPSSDSLILVEADMDYGTLSNGDDGFALVYGNNPGTPMSPSAGGYQILDWIGDWNGDPGQGWEVAGVSNATRDHTLVRKCPVSQGDTSWSNAAGTDALNSQWIVLSQNDWTNIGFHNTCICDSTTNSYTYIFDTICNGLSIVVGSNTYDSTGVYYDTLLSFNGCDSIVTTNLIVLSTAASSGVNYQTICLGDSASVGNSTYYSAGVYADTLISSNGCDSIVTTTLTLVTANYASINGGLSDTSSDPGEFSNYNGYLILDATIMSLLKSATVYSEDTNVVTFELRDDNGVVLDNVTHTVYPGSQSLIFNFLIPSGTDYQLGIDGPNSGLYRNNAGTGNSIAYPFNIGEVDITSSGAGDQYYYFYYDLEIMPHSSYIDTMICDGDSIQIGPNTYDTPGIYVDTFISSNLCDSVVYMILDYYPIITLSIQSVPDPAEICLGDTIILEGSTGFDQYYWISENAVIGQNQQIELSPSQDFWYLLKAMDVYGCSVQEDIWVYVDTCATGIDSEILSNISIYPNPSSGMFTIEFKRVTEKSSNISIVNSIGNIVFSEDLIIGESSRNIDLSEFSQGIYLIELQTELGFYKKKIILQ